MSLDRSLVSLDLDLTVAFHTGTGRNELADYDILLESEQMVDLSADSRLGKDLGGLLEGCRTEPRLGKDRCLGDTEQNGRARCELELCLARIDAEPECVRSPNRTR